MQAVRVFPSAVLVSHCLGESGGCTVTAWTLMQARHTEDALLPL